MPQRQLNIRSDEAADRAARVAKKLGKTTAEVVVEALRSYEESTIVRDELGLTSEQRQRFEAAMERSARAAAHLRLDAPDDHEWLFDENGLPA